MVDSPRNDAVNGGFLVFSDNVTHDVNGWGAYRIAKRGQSAGRRVRPRATAMRAPSPARRASPFSFWIQDMSLSSRALATPSAAPFFSGITTRPESYKPTSPASTTAVLVIIVLAYYMPTVSTDNGCLNSWRGHKCWGLCFAVEQRKT